MSERVITRIWIGGQLERSRANDLVLAVSQSRVSTGAPDWEHVLCQPVSIEGLLEGLHPDGVLHLQDPNAPDGQMSIFTETCRALGLTYRLWHEATLEDGARVELWWPELEDPLRLHGDHCDPHVELIEAGPIRRAIKLLKKNKACLAKHTLMEACPEFPKVPSLELVED